MPKKWKPLKRKPVVEIVNIAYKYPPYDPFHITEHIFCCPEKFDEAMARRNELYAKQNAAYLKSLDEMFEFDDGSWD